MTAVSEKTKKWQSKNGCQNESFLIIWSNFNKELPGKRPRVLSKAQRENNMQRNYELMLIYPANGEEFRTNLINTVKEALQKSGSEIVDEKFLGKKKFYHPINKQIEGEYHTIQMKSEASSVAGLERELNLNRDILRFQFVNQSK